MTKLSRKDFDDYLGKDRFYSDEDKKRFFSEKIGENPQKKQWLPQFLTAALLAGAVLFGISFAMNESLFQMNSGTNISPLTRADVQVLQSNGTFSTDEYIISNRDQLQLLGDLFNQISWESNIKYERGRQEDIKITLFMEEDSNMPERLYEYSIWYHDNSAEIYDAEEYRAGKLKNNSAQVLQELIPPEIIPVQITEEMDQLIAEYIIETNRDRFAETERTMEAHQVLGAAKRDGLIEVYLYVLYEGYSANGEIESGFSSPILIMMEETGQSYKAIDYIEPENGSLYIDSIRKMFPAKYANMAIEDKDKILEQLQKEIDEKKNN